MGWIRKLFGLDFMSEEDKEKMKAHVTSYDISVATVAIRKLAFEICVQRIAAAISKCEYRTYKKHKEEKKDLYYCLNVKPNPHESSTVFWNKLIHRLYYESEALIITNGSNMYVADSFSVDSKSGFGEYTFSDIEINDLKLNKSYKSSDVFYFKLHNKKVKEFLEDTLNLQTSLLSTATSAYKRSNGTKMKVHISRSQTNKDDMETRLNKILNEDMKTFMDSENAVLPEYDGMNFEEVGQKSWIDSRDIKALYDDIIEITSKSFLMPVNIANGEVTDTSKAVDDFLTFCLDAVVELIQDELNGKQFTKSQYLSGNYIKISTQTIKHIDVLDMAGNIDKLIASGAFCINDIMRLLHEEPIEEEWAWQHFMTKNYSPMHELLNALSEKGGQTTNEDEENGNPDANQSGSTKGSGTGDL